MIITIIKFIHILSLVVWLGGMIFFSFIAAPGIFKSLPRETAGDVVGIIFPRYWIMGYVCSITAITTIAALSVQERAYPWLRISLLLLMAILAFYSGMPVGTKARDVKAQIRMIEEPLQKEKLKQEFKTLHAKSAILNGLIIILGVVVIFLMAYSCKL